MKFLGIIEDKEGNVLGVSVFGSADVLLLPDEQIPRSELRSKGRALIERYGIEIPPELDALLPRQIKVTNPGA